EVPAAAVPAEAGRVMLSDPETTPLAVLEVTERIDAGAGLVRLAGPVHQNRPVEHGSFRRLMISPEQGRAVVGGSVVLAFATRGPLGKRQIGQLKHLAGQLKARLLLLPLVSGPAQVVNQPESLIRTVLAAARSLPTGTMVVPVPLAPRSDAGRAGGAAAGGAAAGSSAAGGSAAGGAAARELAACAIVAAAYGATHLMADNAAAVAAGLPSAPG